MLGYLHDLDPGAAYDLLRQLAADSHGSLTETAREIVHRQHERP